jgi:hypothetical protein
MEKKFSSINKNFDEINFGLLGNLLFKEKYKSKINKYANSFK